MKISNRMYYISVLVVIVLLILGGIFIYKSLKNFVTIPENAKGDSRLGDSIDGVATDKSNFQANVSLESTYMSTNTIRTKK